MKDGTHASDGFARRDKRIAELEQKLIIANQVIKQTPTIHDMARIKELESDLKEANARVKFLEEGRDHLNEIIELREDELAQCLDCCKRGGELEAENE